VNLKELLDMHAFDLDRKLAVDPEFLNELNQRHHHDIISFSVHVRPAVHRGELREVCAGAFGEGTSSFRSKGFLAIAGNPRRAIFHGVNNRFTDHVGSALGEGRKAHQPGWSLSAGNSTRQESVESSRSASG
jgi:G3E family GTPase